MKQWILYRKQPFFFIIFTLFFLYSSSSSSSTKIPCRHVFNISLKVYKVGENILNELCNIYRERMIEQDKNTNIRKEINKQDKEGEQKSIEAKKKNWLAAEAQ